MLRDLQKLSDPEQCRFDHFDYWSRRDFWQGVASLWYRRFAEHGSGGCSSEYLAAFSIVSSGIFVFVSSYFCLKLNAREEDRIAQIRKFE